MCIWNANVFGRLVIRLAANDCHSGEPLCYPSIGTPTTTHPDSSRSVSLGAGKFNATITA